MSDKLLKPENSERDSQQTELPTPQAGGISPGLLQRKLQQRLMRRAEAENGVAGHAETAVATASGSSGSLLPETLQRKFEGSLGVDLGGVRVHTGAESAAANESVSARAYTLGNDIHFGAGQYDPSSTAGQHLIAHEVAHTVQQTGGMGRQAQFKLDVSEPGDAMESEADSAADAMVAGQRTTVSSASGVARTVQRTPTPEATQAIESKIINVAGDDLGHEDRSTAYLTHGQDKGVTTGMSVTFSGGIKGKITAVYPTRCKARVYASLDDIAALGGASCTIGGPAAAAPEPKKEEPHEPPKTEEVTHPNQVNDSNVDKFMQFVWANVPWYDQPKVLRQARDHAMKHHQEKAVAKLTKAFHRAQKEGP